MFFGGFREGFFSFPFHLFQLVYIWSVERHLLSCLCQEGLGEPEELLELELGNMLELPEQFDAEDELEPLMEAAWCLSPDWRQNWTET